MMYLPHDVLLQYSKCTAVGRTEQGVSPESPTFVSLPIYNVIMNHVPIHMPKFSFHDQHSL